MPASDSGMSEYELSYGPDLDGGIELQELSAPADALQGPYRSPGYFTPNSIAEEPVQLDFHLLPDSDSVQTHVANTSPRGSLTEVQIHPNPMYGEYKWPIIEDSGKVTYAVFNRPPEEGMETLMRETRFVREYAVKGLDGHEYIPDWPEFLRHRVERAKSPMTAYPGDVGQPHEETAAKSTNVDRDVNSNMEQIQEQGTQTVEQVEEGSDTAKFMKEPPVYANRNRLLSLPDIRHHFQGYRRLSDTDSQITTSSVDTGSPSTDAGGTLSSSLSTSKKSPLGSGITISSDQGSDRILGTITEEKPQQDLLKVPEPFARGSGRASGRSASVDISAERERVRVLNQFGRDQLRNASHRGWRLRNKWYARRFSGGSDTRPLAAPKSLGEEEEDSIPLVDDFEQVALAEGRQASGSPLIQAEPAPEATLAEDVAQREFAETIPSTEEKVAQAFEEVAQVAESVL